MSDFNRWNTAAPGYEAGRAVAIDAGLRAHMIRVYNYMASAVALTGIVAWFTFQAAVTTDAAGAIVGLTAFGDDEVTDLFFINYKLIDTLGHLYGMEDETMRDAVGALDVLRPDPGGEAVAGVVRELDRLVGVLLVRLGGERRELEQQLRIGLGQLLHVAQFAGDGAGAHSELVHLVPRPVE